MMGKAPPATGVSACTPSSPTATRPVTWYAYLLPAGYSGVTPSHLSSSFSLKKTKKEPAKVAHWVPHYFYSVRVLRLRFKGRL